MKYLPLYLLLTAFFVRPDFNLHAQSLYQDAKALAQYIRDARNTKADEGYWFRLAHSNYFAFTSETDVTEANLPLACNTEMSVLVINRGNYPDSLIFYEKQPDGDSTILLSYVLKHDFAIVTFDTLRQDSTFYVSFEAPGVYKSFPVMASSKTSKIFFGSTDASERDFIVYPSRPGFCTIREFINNEITLNQAGKYFLPQVPGAEYFQLTYNNIPQLSLDVNSDRVKTLADSISNSISVRITTEGDSIVGQKVSTEKNKRKYWVFENAGWLATLQGSLGSEFPQTTAYTSERWTGGGELVMKVISKPFASLFNSELQKIKPDSITINGDEPQLYLRNLDDCYPYDRLLLFKKNQLVRGEELTYPNEIRYIRYNEGNLGISCAVSEEIDADNPDYWFQTNLSSIEASDSFTLNGLNLQLRNQHYSCNYIHYTIDLMVDNADKLKSLINFNVYDVVGKKDTVKSVLTLEELNRKPLVFGHRYIVDLNFLGLNSENGILDPADIVFEYPEPYIEKFHKIEMKRPLVFDWYPALDNRLIIFWQGGRIHFYCAPATVEKVYQFPLDDKDSLGVLLGAHSHLRESDLANGNLWGEISEKYRNNPFLADLLKNDLAQNVAEQLPGATNDDLSKRISNKLQGNYNWQKYLFDEARLKKTDQVSYAALSETYRSPIPTASQDLQVASARFESESKKLKRGLSTSDLAAGLSDFIVERAQEELNINFLSRLKDKIMTDSSEFVVLFPNSARVMKDFDIKQYRTLLLYARGGFEQDLRNLGVRFPKLFELPKYKFIQNDPNVYNIFLLYDIANKVYEDTPIDTVLLQVHDRLQERRLNLEGDITRQLANNLKYDEKMRIRLGALVDSFALANDRYEQATHQLNSNYFLDLWAPTLNQIQDLSNQKGNTIDYFAKQFSGPNPYTDLYTGDWQEPDKSNYYFARNNIQGDPDYNYLIDHLSFSEFDQYFSKEPDSSFTIGLGLTNAQKLLAPEVIRDYREKIKELDARIASLEDFRARVQAQNLNELSYLESYLSLFNRVKAVQMKRLMLSLTLETERAQLKDPNSNAYASLLYLSSTLENPERSDLFEWAPFEYSVGLLPLRLDSIKLGDDGKLISLSASSTVELDDDNLELITALSKNTFLLNNQINDAEAFLDEFAATVRKQLQRIRKAYPETKPEKLNKAFRYLLFSPPLVDRILVPDRTLLGTDMYLVIDSLFHDLPVTRALYPAGFDKALVAAYDSLCALKMVPPAEPSGNPFLDYYDQLVPFPVSGGQVVDAPKPLLREIQEVKTRINELEKINNEYHSLLNSLTQVYAPRLTPALRQVEQFDTLVQVTLLWMYGFKSGLNNAGEVIVNDTTVLHMKRKITDYKEASYDTVMVTQRQIATGKGLRQWMTPKQFNEVMDDTLMRMAFLGLLYQRLNAVGNGMSYAKPSMGLLALKFMNNLYEIDDARELLKYKKKNNLPLSFEDYFPFIRTTVNMLNNVFETPLQPGKGTFKERFPTLANVPEVSNESLSLFENVFAGNYSNAVRNVAHLLSITWGLDADKKERRLLAGGKKEMRHWERRDRRNEKIKSSILLYGTFMAGMAEARSADQVKAAIRSVAVPPGNSSVKRNTRMNLDVNGYFGVSYFKETLKVDSLHLPLNVRRSDGAALTVPVGITFSVGQLGRRGKQSISFFFPILDLGAVTAFRLKEENVQSELPKLNFSNIIAPGAYFMYNFPKSPFTLGIGGQLGPQLREVKLNEKVLTPSAYRFGATLTIDVPIFNFYTRQEKKR